MADPSHVGALVLDQAEHWRNGERLSVEDYLEREPSLREDREALLTLVVSEVLLRRSSGEAPTLEEYLNRFPELGDELPVQWEILPLATSAKGTVLGPTPPPADREDAPARPIPEAVAVGLPQAPRIPGYTFLARLGEGGMGIVFKARQDRLGRIVALKIMKEEADERLTARFQEEARSLACLEHPNVVRLYEAGEADGVLYLTMEYVDGPPLDEALAGTPQPPREAAALVETLARAMHYAHTQGILHRDLKPGNMLLQIADCRLQIADLSEQSAICNLQSAIPKITDFGLAKRLDDDRRSRTALVGTPSYMAPEQVGGHVKDLGPHTDVYALGVILYEALIGRPPFLGPDHHAVLRQVLFDDPVPPGRLHPKLPGDLETICLKCLEKEPARRYPTAAALADDCGAFLRGEPIRARPPGVVGRALKFARRRPALAALGGTLAAAAVLATALGGFAYYQYELVQQSSSRLEEIKSQAEKIEREAEEAKARVELAEREVAAEKLRVGRWQYVITVVRASEAYRQGSFRPDLNRSAAQLLDRLRPIGDGTDHRTFEWYAYRRRLTPDGKRAAGAPASRADQEPPCDFQVSVPRVGQAHLAVQGLGAQALAPGAPMGAAALLLVAQRVAALEAFTLSPARACLAFSPDGSLLALGRGGAIYLAEVNARRAWIVGESGGPVAALAFAPTGEPRLAAAGSDGTVRLWDVKTGKEVERLKGGSLRPTALAFSPDGGRLALSGEDGVVCLWDRSLPETTPALLPNPSGWVSSLAFSPDGNLLAVGGATARDGRDAGEIHVWDVATRKKVAAATDGLGAVQALAFSPAKSQRFLAAACADSRLVTWEVLTREPRTQDWGKTTKGIASLAFCPDGKSLLMAAPGTTPEEPGLLGWYDLLLGEARYAWQLLADLKVVGFSPDGRWLVACAADGSASLWRGAIDDATLGPPKQ